LAEEWRKTQDYATHIHRTSAIYHHFQLRHIVSRRHNSHYQKINQNPNTKNKLITMTR
jgi:hypothetical protein